MYWGFPGISSQITKCPILLEACREAGSVQSPIRFEQTLDSYKKHFLCWELEPTKAFCRLSKLGFTSLMELASWLNCKAGETKILHGTHSLNQRMITGLCPLAGGALNKVLGDSLPKLVPCLHWILSCAAQGHLGLIKALVFLCASTPNWPEPKLNGFEFMLEQPYVTISLIYVCPGLKVLFAFNLRAVANDGVWERINGIRDPTHNMGWRPL